MSNDFEVHSIGTAQEIRLSRELAKSLIDHQDQEKLSDEVVKALTDLRLFYGKQIERGDM